MVNVGSAYRETPYGYLMTRRIEPKPPFRFRAGPHDLGNLSFMARLRSGIVVVAVVVGALLVVAAPATAAGWLPAVSSPATDEEGDDQDLAVDAAGNVVAVWTGYTNGEDRVIQTATRPVGGTWSSWENLKGVGEDEGWNPQVAVGANGDAVAVWSSLRFPPSSWTRALVFASTREAGGEWTEPVLLSEPDGIEVTYEPEPIVDADGNATVIWSEETPSGVLIRTRTRPHGDAWGAPLDLTTTGVATGSELALDADGRVTAVWVNRGDGQSQAGIIQSSTRAAGVWSPVVDLSESGGEAGDPRLAVAPQGDAVAVWLAADGGGGKIEAARRGAGSGWAAPVVLSGAEPVNLATVALDSSGVATAAWEAFKGSARVISSSRSTAGQTWSAPVAITAPDDATWFGTYPEMVVDLEGNVTVSWLAWYSPGYNYTEVVRREVGSDWGESVRLGRNNAVLDPQPIVVDPQGYVTVAWARGANLYARVFDKVAPELRDPVLPAVAAVGEKVSMSVDPFDVWSAVTTTWSFGDGDSAMGAAVTHCFKTPGEYTVEITGTDLAANTASTSRGITIAPGPELAPGSDPCKVPDPPDPPDPPGPPGPPGPLDPPRASQPRDPAIAAPRVSALRQSSRRWLTPGTRPGRGMPVGTTFRFRLDRPARLRLAFARIAPGRVDGGACVKPTRANARERPCERLLARGTLTRAGKTGANAIGFRGRLRGTTLAPGRYRLLVTAVADGERSALASLRFRILGTARSEVS